MGEWVKIPLLSNNVDKRSGTNCRVTTLFYSIPMHILYDILTNKKVLKHTYKTTIWNLNFKNFVIKMFVVFKWSPLYLENIYFMIDTRSWSEYQTCPEFTVAETNVVRKTVGIWTTDSSRISLLFRSQSGNLMPISRMTIQIADTIIGI